MTVNIGAVLSQANAGTDPDEIRRYAIEVEAAGFKHFMVYDHVLGATSARLGPGPFGSFPGPPYTHESNFHEVLTLMSHLSAVTSTIEFVSSVLILPQRQAQLAAKQIAAIDLLSGGRFRPAIGTGWNHAETESMGVAWSERVAPGGRTGRDATALVGASRGVRGEVPPPQRCRHQSAPGATDPRDGRYGWQRCRTTTRRADRRWLDAIARTGTRLHLIPDRCRPAPPALRRGGSRSRNDASVRPRLSWAGLAGLASRGRRGWLRGYCDRLPPGPGTLADHLTQLVRVKPEIEKLVGAEIA